MEGLKRYSKEGAHLIFDILIFNDNVFKDTLIIERKNIVSSG